MLEIAFFHSSSQNGNLHRSGKRRGGPRERWWAKWPMVEQSGSSGRWWWKRIETNEHVYGSNENQLLKSNRADRFQINRSTCPLTFRSKACYFYLTNTVS